LERVEQGTAFGSIIGKVARPASELARKKTQLSKVG